MDQDSSNDPGVNPVMAYVAQSAANRGIDPTTAMRMFGVESRFDPTAEGDGHSSFGVPQLHYGGISPTAPHNGLGDEFTSSTGLDARDPSNWQATVDFALDKAKTTGWAPWTTTRNKLGLGNFDGINRSAAAPVAVPDYLSMWGKGTPAPSTPQAGKGAQAVPVPDAVTNAVPDYLGMWAASTPPKAATPQAASTTPAPAPSPYGDLPSRQSFAPQGPLSNAPTDNALAAMAKGAATGGVKGLADVPGFAGNLMDLGDYIMARGEAFATGKPVDQVMADQAARRAQVNALRSQSTIGAIGNALDPRNVLPDGAQVAAPVLARTGEYVPQTPLGRAAMSGVESAVGAAAPGIAGPNALAVAPAATNFMMGLTGSGVSQATGDPLYGMAASALVPSAAAIGGRTGNALAGSVQPETAALADMARTQYGVPVRAGQMAETPGLRFMDSAITNMPFSGAGRDVATQQTAFNRAISRTIGEDAPKLTPDVMSAAKARIGAAFDTVAQNTTIKADPQFQNELQDTMLGAHHELAESEMKPLSAIFDNVVSKIDPSGNIDGSTYQAITRSGTPLGRALESDNPNVRYWAGQIRNSLDDALQRSASPEMQDTIAQAKTQYRNLMTLKPLAAKAPTGDVNPALLQGEVNRNTGNALAFGGGGDLGDLARIGQRFLKPPPSSGTAERTNALNTLGRMKDMAVGAGGVALGANALNALGMTPGQMAMSAASVPIGGIAARGIGNVLRSNALATAMINNSLGRPYQPSAFSSLLFGAIPPFLLQGSSRNALAP